MNNTNKKPGVGVRIMTFEKKTDKKQIVVGMSGGVDSSMSLLLLKEQGWEPVGVSLKYAVWQDKANQSFAAAKEICKKLKAPHYIFNVSKEFKKQVIDYFVSELKRNRTPNPCIICNRYLKFKKLFEWAEKHNIKYVATGHYAGIRKNKKTDKYELIRSKDKNKDQTYSLSFLPQKWLKYIVFPLADYKKEEVFKIAEKQGFDFYLKRKQSQDFCFLASSCLNCFLKKEIGQNSGLIKDVKNNILGEHQGLYFYTLGQRKGINLAGGPFFVIEKDFKNNILIVSKNEKDLLSKQAALWPYNFISGRKLKNKIKVQAKIRSQHNPAKATLIPFSNNKIKIIFDQPQKAITLGQFAVFYQGDICLGGARII